MVDLKKNLYETLGVSNDATPTEIKKAYHKLALVLHPDKNPDNADANEKFQALQKIYSVLSDEEKRKVYDETGEIDDEDDNLGDLDTNALYQYYRTLFAPVTVEAIEEYMAKYKGSSEEATDLKAHFERFDGSIDKVLEWVPCSDESDIDRFVTFFEEQFDVEDYPLYSASKKRLVKAGKAATKAASKNKKPKKADAGDTDDLFKAIQKNRSKREREGASFLDALANKYGESSSGKKKSSKGKKNAGPSDEEFERIQAEMLARRGK